MIAQNFRRIFFSDTEFCHCIKLKKIVAKLALRTLHKTFWTFVFIQFHIKTTSFGTYCSTNAVCLAQSSELLSVQYCHYR